MIEILDRLYPSMEVDNKNQLIGLLQYANNFVLVKGYINTYLDTDGKIVVEKYYDRGLECNRKFYSVDGEPLTKRGHKTESIPSNFCATKREDTIIVTGNELKTFKLMTLGYNAITFDELSVVSSIRKYTDNFKNVIVCSDVKRENAEKLNRVKILKVVLELKDIYFNINDVEEAINSILSLTPKIKFEDYFGNYVFFNSTINPKTGELKTKINTGILQEYIEEQGFFLQQSGNAKVVYKKENHLATKIPLNDYYTCIIDTVNTVISRISEVKSPDKGLAIQILNDVKSLIGDRKQNTNWLKNLKSKEVTDFLDTYDSTYNFFEGNVVRVTKDAIEYVDIDSLGIVIEEESIIKPTGIEGFKCLIDSTESYKELDFYKFIEETSIIQEEDDYCFGMACSNYKAVDDTEAIYYCDNSLLDGKEENGRTGKGLRALAIEKMRPTVLIPNLTNKKLENNFLMSSVNRSTRVIHFDDPMEGTDFRHLKASLTNRLQIEGKGTNSTFVEHYRAPRMIITTNHVPNLTDESSKGRARVVNVKPIYNSKFRPKDKYGRKFFEDYNESDWQKFYNYMFRCQQFYLQNREKGIDQSYESNPIFKENIFTSTVKNKKFIDFCKDNTMKKGLYTIEEIKTEYMNYISMFGSPEKYDKELEVFTSYITAYYKMLGWKPDFIVQDGNTTRNLGYFRDKKRTINGVRRTYKVCLFGNVQDTSILKEAKETSTRYNFSIEDTNAFSNTVSEFLKSLGNEDYESVDTTSPFFTPMPF